MWGNAFFIKIRILLLHDFIFTKYGWYSKITIEMRNTLMNENMFANGSVPVKVAARVYGKGNVNE